MKGNNRVNATGNKLLGAFTQGAGKTHLKICTKIKRIILELLLSFHSA